MRKALYTAIKTVTGINECFQPYMSPDNATTPFAVLKIYGQDEVPYNRSGSIDSFSVMIYTSPDSYVSLDSLELLVRTALDGVELTTDEGHTFIPDYIKTVKDAYDDDRHLIFHSVDFDVAGARPV